MIRRERRVAPEEEQMSEHDPVLGRRITRRTMLEGTALAGVGAFLAACETSGQSSAPTAAASSEASGEPSASDVLNFANWPLYIDQDEGSPPTSPTLEQFTAAYGTKVNYVEAVNDNDSFFGTIQPAPVALE